MLQIYQNSYGKVIVIIISSTKLDGPAAESDEFYIKAGLKDRSHHYEIIKLGINSIKRGLKPWRGRRGTFDKAHPMTTCFHQEEME